MNQDQLPPHLKYLLQPTPTGVASLLAIWDGLQADTQIEILLCLKNIKYPAYLDHRIRTNALNSKLPYIRYLAYRGFYFSKDEPKLREIKERIESDNDPLVRFSTLEQEWFLRDEEIQNPENFFALPHEARLAKVRMLKGHGDDIAGLITSGSQKIIDGKFSDIELYEIVADYLLNPKFQDYYTGDHFRQSYDGYGEYSAGKDMDALWRAVTKAPPIVAGLLIDNLPPGSGLSSGIPEDVLDKLQDWQLERLFYRSEIDLTDLRKKIFKKPASKESERIRYAAVSHNFDLDNVEFAEILSLNDKQKNEELTHLAFSASDLRLCLYDAIHDILFYSDTTAFGSMQESAVARASLERKLKRLSGWAREKELMGLRLYRLACRAVPVKKDATGYLPSNELEFLAKNVVQGDTWRTFMAFENEWDKKRTNNKSLEKFLPRIDEIDEIEDISDEAYQSVNPLQRISEEILSAVSVKLDDHKNGNNIPEALRVIATHITAVQKVANENAKSLDVRLADIEKAYSRNRKILYLIIFLLFIALVMLMR